MADMQTAPDHRRKSAPLAPLAIVGLGLAAGATAWLWMQHGMGVYVAQLASFGWNCL
jgi:hypothetical protein